MNRWTTAGFAILAFSLVVTQLALINVGQGLRGDEDVDLYFVLAFYLAPLGLIFVIGSLFLPRKRAGRA